MGYFVGFVCNKNFLGTYLGFAFETTKALQCIYWSNCITETFWKKIFNTPRVSVAHQKNTNSTKKGNSC